MIDIVNLQRTIKVDTGALRQFILELKSIDEAGDHSFSVALVSDRRMTELNKLFRGKDSTTDVLSFPSEPEEFHPEQNSLGDIVISVEQAQKQAVENELTLEGEIRQ